MEETEVKEENGENTVKKVERTILDIFRKLINPHENVRVKAGSSLLNYLVKTAKNSEGQAELKYALARLVRGLGSPTFVARAGYYSTLVALLNLRQDINPSDILDLVETELHTSRKNSDAENADIRSGQILAFGAAARTDLWKIASSKQKEDLLNLVLTAAKERVYLGLFAYSFIVDLVAADPAIKGDAVFSNRLREEGLKPWAEQTLDSLYLVLSLKLLNPALFSKKHIAEGLGTRKIICPDSLEPLCKILMTIPRVTSLKHPSFEAVVKLLTPDVTSSFFDELDKHLKTPNRNRLLVFIKIITITLRQPQLLNHTADLFTDNLIRQLLGYFRTFKGNQKDNEYREAVQKMFQALIEAFQEEHATSALKIAVIRKFLFNPGTFVFEKVTKSKVVQQITQSLDAEGVKELAAVYKGVVDGTESINSENESETWLNNDRLYSAHLLIKLLNLPTMKLESDWKVEQLTFLLEISLLKGTNGMNVGRELAESLKAAFYGALDLKLSKLEELQSILLKLAQHLNAKINEENLETELRNPISLETFQLWQTTMKKVEKIENRQKKGGIKAVFLTLFLHMGLQLFNDVQLASDSLKELFSCYDRVKKDKKAQPVAESEDDPYWTEVVVDLFLNLLSHNSHLLRSIISSVFPHLCTYMNSTTIHQIVSVLDPTNDENPLSKTVDSDSEESEAEEAEDEEDEVDEQSNDSHSEPESESEEDVEPESATDRLRMALHQVLTNDDNESVDLDDMSDTEGERLDQALGEAFREFRPNRGRRKKQSKDQETLTHFRIRVLDLIEIYLNSSPSMLLTLEIMLPLLQSVEFSIRDEHQKPLNDRLRSVLKKLLGLKKFDNIEGVDHTILADLFKSLLDKGSKNALIVQEMGEQISQCCIFVIKCSQILGAACKGAKRLRAAILEVVSGELQSFLTRRDCLTPYVLFKNILQQCWEGNIGLAIILQELLFSADVRQYQKNQVAELLKLFYSNQRFFSQFQAKVERKMAEAHQQFSSSIVEYFQGLCENPENRNVKERFICNLFHLLAAMKQSPLELSEVSWPEIAHQVTEYRSYKSFSSDAKLAFKKLCKLLNISNVVPMKPHVTKLPALIEEKNDSDDQEEEPKERRKKRKRKSNETLKLRKEAKQLRLESLSKGLEHATEFANSVEEEVKDVEPQEAEESDQETTTPSPKKIGKSNRHSIAVNGNRDSPKRIKKKRKLSE
ncbi:hypothetical protein HUJ04_001143 [Dendroctonus ponderosae]|uniref:DNA polymerase V n=2 Tax=Dendroctonus ponderosae TaxID=77166 RepID=A0AAR5Q437_DENPD|nr:hypothetical protein HUJ04_001143 [Dendroctonus ponderosae]